uniref:FBA_2 domain-containing protein n=1 Tax=Steinernema glaseri TaxID=37863 RepID=A0A1I8AVV1_9BILA
MLHSLQDDDASVPQSGMAAVPFAFLESVCATLRKDSLGTVRSLPDAPSWSSVAEKVEAQTKHFKLKVFLHGLRKFSYDPSISFEEAKQAKYLQCSLLSFTPSYLDQNSTWKVDLPKLLAAVHTKELDMYSIDLTYFESYLNNINPWSLTTVFIYNCKFKSALLLSCWLKKILANKCLSTFSIIQNSFAEPMDPPVDFKEELYDGIVSRGHLDHVAVHNNDSIKDLDISFFKRVLNYWITSRSGFQRQLRVCAHLKRKEKKRKIMKNLYDFGELDELLHASGRENVKIDFVGHILYLEFDLYKM